MFIVFFLFQFFKLNLFLKKELKIEQLLSKMLTARYSAVCVLLAALFAVVVLCATDVCGEYSAGVPRGGDVDAHGPMHIYAAEKKRWKMRAMLQAEVTSTKEAPHTKVVLKKETEDEDSPPDGKAKVVPEKKGATGPSPAEKVPLVDVKVPAVDVSTKDPKAGAPSEDKSLVEHGQKGPQGAVGPAGPKVEGELNDRAGGKASKSVETAAESPGGPSVKGPAVDVSPQGPKGEGPEAHPPAPVKDGEKAAGEGETKSGKEVVPDPSKEQGAGGGASKTGETTKKGGTTTTSLSKKESESETETADFAALVRAPLVFFLLLAALACVCVC